MTTTKLLAPAGSAHGSCETPFGKYIVGADNTVTVDSRAVSDLLNAGFLPFDDDLPAGTSLKSGSYVMTAGDATADAATINTGLDPVTSFVVSIRRAGVDVTNLADITEADGVITIADNSTDYVVTAGDVANWIATGTE